MFDYSVFTDDVIGVDAALDDAIRVERFRFENKWTGENETPSRSSVLNKRLQAFCAKDTRRLIAHLSKKMRSYGKKKSFARNHGRGGGVMATFRYETLERRYAKRRDLACWNFGGARGASARVSPEHYVCVPRSLAIDVGSTDLDAWSLDPSPHDEQCAGQDYNALFGGRCAAGCSTPILPFRYLLPATNHTMICDGCWRCGFTAIALERVYEWSRVVVDTARYTPRYRATLEAAAIPDDTPRVRAIPRRPTDADLAARNRL